MTDKKLIRILQIFIAIGISLILFGHYLLSYTDFTQQHGVVGIMICAACIALGFACSLPTKMYLTFVLVKRENEQKSTD
ncbi:hypothetical protein [Moritella sp. Urea-trap-13]|uniref:hypothetical protein n=1 Tax=Moritella sp. Urea-trap-13 TaxID=2058327 RepID=UPI000C33470A|nr:hypothetical protein [Moritella sp. Urea-trap-13]PKH07837.1 hypothetical protein CXF93_03855 [Moritella sp. Urea-trap-13]